jgi:hypothetical protein
MRNFRYLIYGAKLTNNPQNSFKMFNFVTNGMSLSIGDNVHAIIEFME